jgi:hypothetical protein
MSGKWERIWFGLMAAAACAAQALPAAAEESYAVFDALFLQRDNVSIARPLVLDASGGPAAISTGDLRFSVQPGMRLFYGHVGEESAGWEVGYLGVWGMFADANAANAGTLQAPDPLGTPDGVLNGADFARATYSSSLNSAEANLFFRSCDGGYNRRAGEPWRRCDNYCQGTLDWLVGFRWAGLDESAALAFSPSGNPGAGLYALNTTTNLAGVQLGSRGRMTWDRWAFEGWAKVALAGSAMSQSQSPIYNSIIEFEERPGQSSREGGVGFIGDMNFTAVYRLTDTWGLRMGYNLIWLSGVALAPNQFDFSSPPAGGTQLHGGSSVFLSGANLGLEARW